LGFIVGPAIGGFVARWGSAAPMYVAALLCFFNFLWAYFALPETMVLRSPGRAGFRWAEANPLLAFKGIGANAGLRSLLLASVFHFIAFAQLQGNITVYFKDVLSWNASQMGLVFLMVGVADFVTQGYLFGRLHRFFDEARLSAVGLSIAGVMYLVFVSLLWFHIAGEVYFVYLIYAFGKGLFEPSMSSLVSKAASEGEQGKAQGGYQSVQSLTRVVGPLSGAFLYGVWRGLPYLVCAVLTFVSVVLFSRLTLQKE
jgi:DHA1 family tetracycline resistance protein-like MFS transporter